MPTKEAYHGVRTMVYYYKGRPHILFWLCCMALPKETMRLGAVACASYTPGPKSHNPELIQKPWVQGPDLIYPEKGKVYATRGHPKPCLPCQQHLEETIGFHAQSVVHADLIPTFVGLRIFAAMPQRVRMQALVAAFKGKGALQVLSSWAVARVRPP